ncbi:hypothetical protein SAMN06265174_103314 [Dietzia kunjamensis subsp. schimae]|uniref:Integral membrane protein n=1 Tax=Dietzia kunjamensis subsp. schimae TaxID=498198 RepID=A0ABY1N0Z5_9ACTN|nr:hypothetical protein [Dietzia kunjamensis]MBB1015021.1 hypothetical protein [Dietzia kunjamensis subsp. schimae]SMO67970.1 hypothetical protein SAMN06265174_103314 [Dietzia kunjamensis subsp. schimae]
MSEAFDIRVVGKELHIGPIRIGFQRTLRIPEDGLHPLPPGLGLFPIRRVQDYPDTAPAEWLARGGVMLPVYQREAMWISLDSSEPAALQVGIGKVCAISGEEWDESLSQDPQNYAALPDQPWLDGINAGDGFIRQFVAIPLGLGATVEGQVTGREEHGGVQLRAVGLTAAALEDWGQSYDEDLICYSGMPLTESAPAMGLGAGGRMRQEVYEDDRDLSDYDESKSGRVFVHLCSAAQWTAITGEVPPETPVDRDEYTEAGLPWFDYYDSDRNDLAPADSLGRVKSVEQVLGGNDKPHPPVPPANIVTLRHDSGDPVKDGAW